MNPAEEVMFILNFPDPSVEDAIFLAWRLSKIPDWEQYLEAS
jgi:hypothetical protein